MLFSYFFYNVVCFQFSNLPKIKCGRFYTFASCCGKTLDVVYEGIDYDRQLFFGRSVYHTPEADALVLFKSKIPVDIGKIYKVKITKVKGYDLQGEVVYED